jgi:hypothetical protein
MSSHLKGVSILFFLICTFMFIQQPFGFSFDLNNIENTNVLVVSLGHFSPFKSSCRGRLKYPQYRYSDIDNAIYLSHLSALTGLCLSGKKYGLVLENDVEPVGKWPITLRELSDSNNVDFTILAPSVLRRHHTNAFLKGRYTVIEDDNIWGAGAYLYNLRTACTKKRYLSENVGCVPWDFAAPSLLSHATVTVPWYIYKENPNGSHKDETQKNLHKLREWAVDAWQQKNKSF